MNYSSRKDMACTRRWVLLVWLLCILRETTGTEYINVALGKPTTQSSTAIWAESSRAVDGDRNADFWADSCTHTHDWELTWWIVDLLEPYPIHSIQIALRHGDIRLRNFTIYVSDVNPLPLPQAKESVVGQVCLHYPGTLPYNGLQVLTCDKNITGRYVFVHKVGSGSLLMCEFEVLVRPDYDRLSQLERFDITAGKTSNLSPFYSTILDAPWSLKCATMCMLRSDGSATVVQMDLSTGRCDCIQYSKLDNVDMAIAFDDGWVFMEVASN